MGDFAKAHLKPPSPHYTDVELGEKHRQEILFNMLNAPELRKPTD